MGAAQGSPRPPQTGRIGTGPGKGVAYTLKIAKEFGYISVPADITMIMMMIITVKITIIIIIIEDFFYKPSPP